MYYVLKLEGIPKHLCVISSENNITFKTPGSIVFPDRINNIIKKTRNLGKYYYKFTLLNTFGHYS